VQQGGRVRSLKFAIDHRFASAFFFRGTALWAEFGLHPKHLAQLHLPGGTP
jgi:hypothetical protein